MSLLLEHALRVAAFHHQGQVRKGGQLPYIIHPTSVAMILAQNGYEDDILAAALLHDVLEDTNCTEEQLRQSFPVHIVEWVIHLSEIKQDAQGEKIPWKLRKQMHLERIRSSDWQVRAVKLGDKIHNMQSIVFDLVNGIDAWSVFNAPPEEVVWYYREALDACNPDAEQLKPLVKIARRLIGELTELLPKG
jgi:(p)ppGpp synthase/HD superfamily hydrolase